MHNLIFSLTLSIWIFLNLYLSYIQVSRMSEIVNVSNILLIIVASLCIVAVGHKPFISTVAFFFFLFKPIMIHWHKRVITEMGCFLSSLSTFHWLRIGNAWAIALVHWSKSSALSIDSGEDGRFASDGVASNYSVFLTTQHFRGRISMFSCVDTQNNMSVARAVAPGNVVFWGNKWYVSIKVPYHSVLSICNQSLSMSSQTNRQSPFCNYPSSGYKWPLWCHTGRAPNSPSPLCC